MFVLCFFTARSYKVLSQTSECLICLSHTFRYTKSSNSKRLKMSYNVFVISNSCKLPSPSLNERKYLSSTSQMLYGLSFTFRLLGCFPFILFSSNLEIINFQDWKGGALIQQFASAHCIPPAEPTKVGYFTSKNGRD